MPAEEKAFWEQCRAETRNISPLFSKNNPLLPGEQTEVVLDRFLTASLLRLEKEDNIRLDALLLSALGRAASIIAGGDVGICVESLGRPNIDSSIRTDRTVGWFTALYPVVIKKQNDVSQLVFDVRRKLQRIPQSGIGWLLLYNDLPANVDLLFNFYRYRSDEKTKLQPVLPNGEHSFDAEFPGMISADCSFVDGKITVLFRAPPLRRAKDLLNNLKTQFLQALKEITDRTDFSSERADSADKYSDNDLTYSEMSMLDKMFNNTDYNEQN